MSRKKLFWIILFVAVFAGAWYAYSEYNRTQGNLKDQKADYVLEASKLLGEFENREMEAQKKYIDQVVEIRGKVKGTEQEERSLTIVLGDENSPSSIRCAMDTLHHQDASGLAKGSSVIIRGICTGFNRDEMGLGSDLILNRCVIIDK